MSTFAVIREAGPNWATGGIYRQPDLDEHSAFMNTLADEGVLLLAGPLAGSEHGRARVLLILDADSETTIHRRLAHDPWVTSRQLVTRATEPWTIVVGAERLAATARDMAP
jgi:uncharacterized protein YciI